MDEFALENYIFLFYYNIFTFIISICYLYLENCQRNICILIFIKPYIYRGI